MELVAELEQVQADLRTLDYRDAGESLSAFTRQAWKIVEPDTPLLWNWHLDLVCEHLEAVSRGECHALAINMPPRYMKSLLVSVMWPCWEWTRRPALRYLFASYSANLSTAHSLSRRRIIESPWYMDGMAHHWRRDDPPGSPAFALVGDQNVKTLYENTYRGHMIATSVGGSATGQGGDRVIIDDPVNPEEALSDAKRLTANQFFDWTLSTRLNDKHEGAFVIVMQRLHTDDLTGHVLAEGGWEHVCIPGIAEAETDVVFPSGRIVHRAEGELLWPERESASEVERVRKRLNSYGFAGQYQQRPVPLEGGVIKRAYFRFWTRERLPGDDEDVLLLPETLTNLRQSWDTTYWEALTSDYCVGQVWGDHLANRYLLDQDRAKRDLASTKSAIRALTAKWPAARRKLLERTANGSEVLRSMQEEIPGLIGVTVKSSKEARLMAVLSYFEARNVILPHPREAGWVADFIAECIAFPAGTHDDQVDAMTQALDDESTPAGPAGSGGAQRATTIANPRTASVGAVGGSRA